MRKRRYRLGLRHRDSARAMDTRETREVTTLVVECKSEILDTRYVVSFEGVTNCREAWDKKGLLSVAAALALGSIRAQSTRRPADASRIATACPSRAGAVVRVA